ncbi:Asp23/Gls24 family envelope stress response protein [Streptomyces alkaliphilus]|uniref:Asp23/Gls24 family envelope stress response protein n=1 Tax=Streptomyces alkaliphilus TaxID=1472722 RepID=UPI001295FB40|nr:Asp23/Gls24 family envelope stress response protein [Streptomyces alkaliphilus]
MTDVSEARTPTDEAGGTGGATDAARWPPGPRTVPPGERGATRIADRVVTKIAEQAVREALRAGPGGPPSRGGEDTAAGAPAGVAPTAPPVAPVSGRAGPRAEVSVRRQPAADGTGGLARVRVEVELDYPGDLTGRCDAIRRRVTERLIELAGMEVPGVALVVSRLHSAHRRTGRTGRVG